MEVSLAIRSPQLLQHARCIRAEVRPEFLYIYESWEELRKEVATLDVQPPPLTEVSLKWIHRLGESAMKADIELDEELAYIKCNLYLQCLIPLLKKTEHTAKVIPKDGIKILEEIIELLHQIMTSLQNSLIVRYRMLNEQKTHIYETVCPILKQHCLNVDAEREATKQLNDAREELETLRTRKSVLLLEVNSQQKKLKGPALVKINVPDELKCPICFDIYQEKIFLCRNGHSICSSCYNNPAIKACAECRASFHNENVRNWLVERLISSWRFECPFIGKGCNEKILSKEMTLHVESCFYGKSEEAQSLIKLETEMKKKQALITQLEATFIAAYNKTSESHQEWSEKVIEFGEYYVDVLGKIVYDCSLLDTEKKLSHELKKLAELSLLN